MAVEVERLLVTLEARLDTYNRNLTQAHAITNARLNTMEARFSRWAANLKNSASSAALGIGSAFAGISGALVGRELVMMANEWTRLTRAVDASQKVFGIALYNTSQLTDLANDARVDVTAYQTLFIRTAAAIRDYGLGAETAATMTSTLSKALKLGGASASEQASTLLQFSQALQKGKLDGDEFRTVMENAGVVQELLAKKLKVSKGEIITMAAAGKLQIGTLIGALVEGAGEVDRIFNGIPATIDEGFSVLRNNVTRYVGQLDQATGASQTFVDILGLLSRNLHQVASAAAVLGAALLASFSGGALTALVGFAARLLSLRSILAGSAAAAVSFGYEVNLNLSLMTQALAQGADMGTAFARAMQENSLVATTVSDQFRGLVNVIGSDLLSAMDGISLALTGHAISWDKVKAGALIAIGAIVGGVKTIRDMLSASFEVIPLAGEVAFKELANKIIRVLNWISEKWTAGVNGMLQTLNQLPGFDYKVQSPDIIGEFDTSDAYDKGAEISRRLSDGIKQNFDLKGFADRVQAEADQIAIARAAATDWKPVSGFDPRTGKPPVTVDADAERARKKFDKDLAEAESRLRLQEMEQASIGRSTYETERLRVQTELLNSAREAGVRLGEADRVKIDAISAAMARAVVEAENTRAAYQLLRDETTSFFSEFAKGVAKGESATELLANGLDRIADKLIDMAVEGLVDQALGGLIGRGGAQSGASGGLASGFASLFGFADGGVMVTGKGPAKLPRFARGGVSKSAAIFGEAGPEAAVPLPDGRRIPVDLRVPELPKISANPSAAAPVLNMALNIDARGATAEGVRGLSSDLVPQIQKVVQTEVAELFDRNSRFARSGV